MQGLHRRYRWIKEWFVSQPLPPLEFHSASCGLDLNYLRRVLLLGFRRTSSSPAARARFTSGCEVRRLLLAAVNSYFDLLLCHGSITCCLVSSCLQLLRDMIFLWLLLWFPLRKFHRVFIR